MVIARSLLVAALGTVAVTPALGQECSQAQAIYGDRDGAYELRFEPVGSESAVTSNHFKVAVLKPDLLLDGVVMPTGEPERRPASSCTIALKVTSPARRSRNAPSGRG